MIRLCKLIGITLLFTIGMLFSAERANAAASNCGMLPDTGETHPSCCFVDLSYSGGVTADTLATWKQAVEDPSGTFLGNCTADNTSYYDSINNSYLTANRCNLTNPCRTPTYIYYGGSQLGVVYFNYEAETRIYGTYLSENLGYGTNPYCETKVDTTSSTYNSSVPDKCTEKDSHAESIIPNGSTCAYMVCDVNGYWSSPPSESFNTTCPLNPIFQFEVEGPTSTGLQTTGIDTAIGCFPSTPEGIATAVLRIVMGISGLVALVVIIASIVTIMTSADNPEKVKESYSKITYAVVGLVLIVLSIFILRFIGIKILNLSIPAYR